ncbi:MAG: YfhO family protein [Clostridia bacterium]|nr:YfhO family protein [Clostridia bacterium]
MDNQRTLPSLKPQTPFEKLRSRLNLKSTGYLVWAMLLPAILMYLMYLAREIHPFGNGSVLVLDLNAQYVSFFEALRKFAYGDASLLYSFSRAMGGEFLGIYAYYIASPFSYIVCLFPEDKILDALLFIFLLKTAICGGTFGYYLHKTSKNPKPFAIVCFSILYALSSYCIIQQHNTMWIDAVMWLPLITLGIEAVIKHGKYKLYTALLALTLLSNFYIGYMVCIYCLIYFFYYYFANNEDHRNNPHGEKKHFTKSLLRMALFSLIAIGIAMVILLSAYYGLNFGKTTFSDPNWSVWMNFDILEFLYKFLPGSYDTVRPEGYPFLYCGVLTLLLIPAYFLCKRYTNREKIAAGILILVFTASMFLSLPDLIWHGFQRPNWLNYRYSFMLCFFLCVLACRAFSHFEQVSLKSMAVTAGGIGLLCVFLQKYTDPDNKYFAPNDFTCIWFTLILLFAYLCVLAVLKKGIQKQSACIVLLTVICIEVFLNGLWNMNSFDKDVIYSSYNGYNDFLASARPIVNMVQEQDTGFYRMEKSFNRTVNDNMALAIRGLSGSTSTLNKETIQFLNKMGYSASSHWARYAGGTPVSDSLLGVKYIISNGSNHGVYYYDRVGTHPDSPGYVAFKNPYALSLAYGVSDDILNFEMGYTNAPIVKEDEEESKLADLIASLKGKLNDWFDIDETVNNSTYIDHYDSPFERMNAIVHAMVGENSGIDDVFAPVDSDGPILENITKGYTTGHISYTKRDKEQKSYFTYSLTMTEDNELFFYLPSDYPREVKLSLCINGTWQSDYGTFFGGETSRIISLGNLKAGTEVDLKLELKGDVFYAMMGKDPFYCINWDAFKASMAHLGADQYQITDFTEDSFEGTFTTSRKDELVLTSLAYDKAWKIYVDGERVEVTKALGSLLAFRINGEAGQTHTIEMRYLPNTFTTGLVISFLSLGLLILIIVFEKKMKTNKYLRAVVCVPETEGGTGTDAESTEDAEQISIDDLPLPEEDEMDPEELLTEEEPFTDETDPEASEMPVAEDEPDTDDTKEN